MADMMMLEKIQKGVNLTLSLPSFPLFCGYLLMIFLSGFWQRSTSPLNLRPAVLCAFTSMTLDMDSLIANVYKYFVDERDRGKTFFRYDRLLILHNFGCCIASLVTLCGFCYGLYTSDSVYQKSPTESMRFFFWLYWCTKNVELLDTVFMILRHRQRQISFLHVYHHSSMLLLSDLGYRMYPWPAIAMFLAINSFVHVVLYLYYGLSAIMPDSPPQWKKQLTQMQIIQFLIDFVLAGYGHLHHGFCVYGFLYGITMTLLFSNFYYFAYVKQRKRPEEKLKSS